MPKFSRDCPRGSEAGGCHLHPLGAGDVVHFFGKDVVRHRLLRVGERRNFRLDHRGKVRHSSTCNLVVQQLPFKGRLSSAMRRFRTAYPSGGRRAAWSSETSCLTKVVSRYVSHHTPLDPPDQRIGCPDLARAGGRTDRGHWLCCGLVSGLQLPRHYLPADRQPVACCPEV
jgi:hypothetical protein